MGFSQCRDVRFLKGVPGWSWTPFLIDFGRSWEALGDHLRPPLGDLGDTLGAGGGHSGSLWEHWSHFQRTLGPLCGLWGEISGSEASCMSLFCKICRFFQGICTLFCTWVKQNRIVFGKLSSFQRASRSLAKTGSSDSFKT